MADIVRVFAGVNPPHEVFDAAAALAEDRNKGRTVAPFATVYEILTEWTVAGWTAYRRSEAGPDHKRTDKIKA